MGKKLRAALARVRIAASIISALGVIGMGAVGYLLPITAGISAAETALRVDAFFAVGCITLLAVTIVGVLDYIQGIDAERRDKRRNKRDQKRNRKRHEDTNAKLDQIVAFFSNKEQPLVAEHIETMTATASGIIEASTLRMAALDLSKQIRDLIASAKKKGGTDMDEWKMSQDFILNFYSRLRRIKARLETVLGWDNVASAGKWVPIGFQNIERIAEHLEREALQVPPEVPT